MARIQVMSEQLANQIAAGEVVERPASVVKELVENALDAGSTSIEITAEEGGLKLIRVMDNGDGMTPEEMPLAFLRHATSKLLSDRDLFRIASLGFRGEALPSIAAVSRVSCVSAPSADGRGSRLVIEGGTILSQETASAPQGTEMTVRDLFYNTPARLKYMKAVQTELGHISDYVYRLALAHPGVAFSLKHNGNGLLHTLGNGDRLQVIAAVYGTNTARAMLPVQGEHPDYHLGGFISKPELTRAGRTGITIIVNGRYIKSVPLQQAVLQAYHTLLPINRFPLVVLELGMHPSLVDVNVHPAKMEVRFSLEAELKAFVQSAVQQALASAVHIPGPDAALSGKKKSEQVVQEQLRFPTPAQQDQPEWRRPDERQAASLSYRVSEGRPAGGQPMVRESYTAATGATGTAGTTGITGATGARAPAGKTGSIVTTGIGNNKGSLVIPADAADKLYRPSEPAPVESVLADSAQTDSAPAAGVAGNANAAAFPDMSFIGQLHGTYLIAQNEEGMFLIDQHAAHERIHYEAFYDKFSRPADAMQQVLVPFTLEYTSADAAVLMTRLDLLLQAGVELEPFGGQTFLVRAHPAWLPQGEEQQLVEEMAEWVLREKRAIDIGRLREQAAILCACKASIKANQRLGREGAEVLIRRLAACRQPYTCPHGRPIVVQLTTYQLEKMFKRVMS